MDRPSLSVSFRSGQLINNPRLIMVYHGQLIFTQLLKWLTLHFSAELPGDRVLPYMYRYIDYTGMYCCTGYGFQAFFHQEQGIENLHFRLEAGCQI